MEVEVKRKENSPIELSDELRKNIFNYYIEENHSLLDSSKHFNMYPALIRKACLDIDKNSYLEKKYLEFIKDNADSIISLFDRGIGMREVSKKLKIPRRHIEEFKISNKINLKKVKPNVIEEVLRLRVQESILSSNVIGEKVGISGNTVLRILSKYNIKPSTYQDRRPYILNIDFFEKINSHEKAYILGFLFADGYNNEVRGVVTLGVAEQDKEILMTINHLIQPNRKNSINVVSKEAQSKYSNKKVQNFYYTNFLSIKISKDLAKLGCTNNKSLSCIFPDLAQEYINSFIAGYFDGDGCVYRVKSKYIPAMTVDICCSDRFAIKLKEILQKVLSVNCQVNLASPRKKIAILRMGGYFQCEKFLSWIYKDTPIKLKRKFNKFKEIQQSREEYAANKNK